MLSFYIYTYLGWYLNFRVLEFHWLFMCECLLLPILSTKQLWFLHSVRCDLSANLRKAVLTFSAERLITESTKEWHVFSDEVQGLWTMAVLSHCINAPDSAVIVQIYCTKANFVCMIGFYVIMTIRMKMGITLSGTKLDGYVCNPCTLMSPEVQLSYLLLQ